MQGWQIGTFSASGFCLENKLDFLQVFSVFNSFLKHLVIEVQTSALVN